MHSLNKLLLTLYHHHFYYHKFYNYCYLRPIIIINITIFIKYNNLCDFTKCNKFYKKKVNMSKLR